MGQRLVHLTGVSVAADMAPVYVSSQNLEFYLPAKHTESADKVSWSACGSAPRCPTCLMLAKVIHG